jgi:hypothetical protein
VSIDYLIIGILWLTKVVVSPRKAREKVMYFSSAPHLHRSLLLPPQTLLHKPHRSASTLPTLPPSISISAALSLSSHHLLLYRHPEIHHSTMMLQCQKTKMPLLPTLKYTFASYAVASSDSTALSWLNEGWNKMNTFSPGDGDRRQSTQQII